MGAPKPLPSSAAPFTSRVRNLLEASRSVAANPPPPKRSGFRAFWSCHRRSQSKASQRSAQEAALATRKLRKARPLDRSEEPDFACADAGAQVSRRVDQSSRTDSTLREIVVEPFAHPVIAQLPIDRRGRRRRDTGDTRGGRVVDWVRDFDPDEMETVLSDVRTTRNTEPVSDILATRYRGTQVRQPAGGASSSSLPSPQAPTALNSAVSNPPRPSFAQGQRDSVSTRSFNASFSEPPITPPPSPGFRVLSQGSSMSAAHDIERRASRRQELKMRGVSFDSLIDPYLHRESEENMDIFPNLPHSESLQHQAEPQQFGSSSSGFTLSSLAEQDLFFRRPPTQEELVAIRAQAKRCEARDKGLATAQTFQVGTAQVVRSSSGKLVRNPSVTQATPPRQRNDLKEVSATTSPTASNARQETCSTFVRAGEGIPGTDEQYRP